MSQYSKLVVAVLGAILIALNQFAGINIGIDAQSMLNFAIPILTSFGVWAVPNATP